MASDAGIEAMTERMSTDQVRELYDGMAPRWRLFGIVDWLLGINRLRRKHFSDVAGDVLDVACGTGENFQYLQRADSVTAFDLSPEMVGEARLRTRQMRMDVALSVGDAEQMPYPDAGFDTVISALSSCTFPDYVAAFREMERVARPGGRILLVEHGRSTVGLIARRQDRRFDQVYQRSACRHNRDVVADLTEAGLDVASHRHSNLGMLNTVTIEVG